MEGIKNRSGFSVKARYLDAQGRYRVLETRAHPHLSAVGELMGMIGANVDITEREEAERARELLVAELNHRVKNTLAIVQGIAHQTFGHGGDPTEARKAFEGRLVALAGAHNLLTEANWENASLQELAAITLDTAGANANRISLAGPRILLLRVLPEPSVDLAWREVRPLEQDPQPDPRRGGFSFEQGLRRGLGRVDRGRLHFGGKRRTRDARQHKADENASGGRMQPALRWRRWIRFEPLSSSKRGYRCSAALVTGFRYAAMISRRAVPRSAAV